MTLSFHAVGTGKQTQVTRLRGEKCLPAEPFLWTPEKSRVHPIAPRMPGKALFPKPSPNPHCLGSECGLMKLSVLCAHCAVPTLQGHREISRGPASMASPRVAELTVATVEN